MLRGAGRWNAQEHLPDLARMAGISASKGRRILDELTASGIIDNNGRLPGEWAVDPVKRRDELRELQALVRAIVNLRREAEQLRSFHAAWRAELEASRRREIEELRAIRDDYYHPPLPIHLRQRVRATARAFEMRQRAE